MSGFKRKFTYYMGDFETTVYEGQTYTEVWLAGICEFYTENAIITQSMEDWFDSVFKLNKNAQIFFHNLKFDCSFIIDWLKRRPQYREALYTDEEGKKHFKLEKDLRHNEYTYLISDKGVFYNLVLKHGSYVIKIVDSYKILPMSLATLGQAFQTKHQKLDMEYEGYREANGVVKDNELEYMKNDLFVGKECLEYMLDRGHKKVTIGSNCIHEFKKIYDKEDWNILFPNVYEHLTPDFIDDFESIGEYVNKSYHGGWTYADKRRRDTVLTVGLTADANSLYPSQMHSDSGNAYPVGMPTFWTGNIPNECDETKYFFVRFKCSFELKKNYLPFVQIKGDPRFRSHDMLDSSQPTREGFVCYEEANIVTMTMTCVDFVLFKEHYHVNDLVILDGCYFDKVIGLFDEYINKYKELKENAKNKAERTLAKLFLNNLYGRFAMYIDSSFKICHLKDDIISFESVKEYEKIPGYIPVGSAITSYARNETIRKAQMNYDRFAYADTDSLHCIGQEPLKGVPIHDSKFCYWKIELEWDVAIFHRSKTYIEGKKEGEKINYEITCAGMGKKCKSLVRMALEKRDGTLQEYDKKGLSERQIEFIEDGMSLTDFKKGLKVDGNLKPVRIPGGIVLREKTFVMRF